MKSSNIFVTGCDRNTEWMLPWFITNFRKHNPDAKICLFDWGMSKQMRSEGVFLFDHIITMKNAKGWFNKPMALKKLSKIANKVCWLDTDCEVLDNIEEIFRIIVPGKLNMVVDEPWTKRRNSTWHNSGVIAFEGCPEILNRWVKKSKNISSHPNPLYGDQDILHELLPDQIVRMSHINDLPKEYNTLRLDLKDGTHPKHIKIMHWTGKKGKLRIKEKQ